MQEKYSSNSEGGSARSVRAALVGLPNTGKTTLFNALTGLQQRVANYPGITVEKRWGTLRQNGFQFEILDLPGSYSLDAQSEEERVVHDVLVGIQSGTERPDLLVAVVDPFHFDRGLYLASQLKDIGFTVILAVNFWDEVKKQHLKINLPLLEKRFGLPTVAVSALKGEGLEELKGKILSLSSRLTVPVPPRWVPTDITEATNRYRRIQENLQGVVSFPTKAKLRQDTIDRFLLHPLLGPLVFLGVTLLIFQSVFTWALLPMGWIQNLVDRGGAVILRMIPNALLGSFLVDGVLAGVGSVITFLPQIIILFFFIGVLEDTGYLARGAFLLDRLMSKVGLNGKSFLPLFSCFACAIPGIMAARTIENRKERLVTILVSPFMTCSARLPIYAVVTAALIPPLPVLGIFNLQGIIFVSMYMLGIVAAMVMAWVFKRGIPSRGRSHFFLELPPYRMPHWKSILVMLRNRVKVFLRMAGSIILILSICLWVALYFPRPKQIGVEFAQERARLVQTIQDPQLRAPALEQLKHDETSRYLEESLAGRLGRGIEPLLRPLGFDWRIGVGILASFAQREVFVSTLAIVHRVESPGSESFLNLLRLHYTPLIGLSILVFYALACQCMATLAVVRRETGGWGWPLFMFGYMSLLAYGASFLVYQGGKLLGMS